MSDLPPGWVKKISSRTGLLKKNEFVLFFNNETFIFKEKNIILIQ